VFTHPLVHPFYLYLGPLLKSAANYSIKTSVHMTQHVIALTDVYWSQCMLGTDTPNQPHISIDGEVMPVCMILEHLMDDDKLSNRCWCTEMREVELWENKQFASMFFLFFSICAIQMFVHRFDGRRTYADAQYLS
jgi:hypothetical protein